MKASLVLLASLLQGQIALACEGRITQTPMAPVVYDPLTARDLSVPLQLVLRNTGAAVCRYHVHIKPDGPQTPSVRFTVEADDGGQQVISDQLAPNDDTIIDLILGIDAGLMIAPGDVLLGYSVRLTADKLGMELDNAVFTVPLKVLPVVSLTIAGAGIRGTMNFGELAEGAQRSVILHTRANIPYRLDVSSRHRALSLQGSTAAPQIPYVLLIDGVPLSTLNASLEIVSGGGASHTLTAQIGVIGMALAGLYTDTVTIEIGPRH